MTDCRISKDDIKAIKKSIHANWRSIILDNGPMQNCFLNSLMKVSQAVDQCIPKYSQILLPFSHCGPEKIRVVIIDQSPAKIGAHGYAYSSTQSARHVRIIDQSLKTSCNMKLTSTNFAKEWSDQGVLLLNRCLTTDAACNEVHSVWISFTNYILKFLTETSKNIIYVIWGELFTISQYLQDLGVPQDMILLGAHPNEEDAFIKKRHFALINSILQSRDESPIKWGNDLPPVCNLSELPDNIHVVFTDGAARKNGSLFCTAGWGYYFANGPFKGHCEYGPVEGTAKHQPSNNRGELYAAIKALKKIKDNLPLPTEKTPIYLVSDSTYVINIIAEWLNIWIRDGRINEMKNPDYLNELNFLKINLQPYYIVCHKVKAHITCAHHTPEETYLWSGNYIADLAACAGVYKTAELQIDCVESATKLLR